MHLELEGPGFAKLFGNGYTTDVRNLLFRVDRQDRAELTAACKAARTAQDTIHVDIAWEIGTGLHANSDENYFNTLVGIVPVGRKEDADLLYFAIKDVSARRSAEHKTARSQFSSALRALFDEIFLLNLDTGSSEPIYAGGRPLVKEDGSPIDTGFHALFRTVHRDDIRLFWKYSNYTFVEDELFGPEPADAITFDLRRSDENGAFHWERMFISRVASADNHKNVLVCIQNIDEQKDAQRRERELLSRAQTDALTGIYNRGTSEELIRAKLQGLTTGEGATFAIVDVDDFKRVNDTYGHDVGDKVLRGIADVLKLTFRDEDIIFRLGGDEYAVYVMNLSDEENGKVVMDRVFKEISDMDIPELKGREVCVSAGAAFFKEDSKLSFEELYKQADSGVYESKKICGSTLFFR